MKTAESMFDVDDSWNALKAEGRTANQYNAGIFEWTHF